MVRNDPDVAGYRFSAANTLDEAFNSPTTMTTILRGAKYRSYTLRRKSVGINPGSTRGLTVFQYDPEDFWIAGSNLPHDAAMGFVRLEELNEAGVYRPPGPISIVPPPVFYTNTRPNLTVAGTAPDVAASTLGIPPAGALHFVLPRFADAASLTNSGNASLFVSFNPQMPEFKLLHGQTTFLPDAAMSEVLVRGDGREVPFSMFFAVVNAEMA